MTDKAYKLMVIYFFAAGKEANEKQKRSKLMKFDEMLGKIRLKAPSAFQ